MSLTTPSLESALQQRLLQRANDDAASTLMHMKPAAPAGANVVPYEVLLQASPFPFPSSSPSPSSFPEGPESNADVMPAYEAMLQQRANDDAAFALMFMDHL